jgi:DNA-binding IclR family transcriptional regulator
VTKIQAAERSGIQVIARAASILRCLKDETVGLSLGQIAERVSLPRSTVQRIVSALMSERFVMAANPESGIRLGPELDALAAAAKIDLADILRPILQTLSERTGETVDLAVLRDNQLVFIDQIPGKQRLRAVSFVGEAFTLTNSANGKACLAIMPPAEAERLAIAELRRLGTKRTLASLLEELQQIRHAGIALDRDEHNEGISAAGFAFRDFSGGYGAISVPTPTQRFKMRQADIVAALGAASKAVEARLGAR